MMVAIATRTVLPQNRLPWSQHSMTQCAQAAAHVCWPATRMAPASHPFLCCCRTFLPAGVFTNVAHYVDWIKKGMKVRRCSGMRCVGGSGRGARRGGACSGVCCRLEQARALPCQFLSRQPAPPCPAPICSARPRSVRCPTLPLLDAPLACFLFTADPAGEAPSQAWPGPVQNPLQGVSPGRRCHHARRSLLLKPAGRHWTPPCASSCASVQ